MDGDLRYALVKPFTQRGDCHQPLEELVFVDQDVEEALAFVNSKTDLEVSAWRAPDEAAITARMSLKDFT